MTRRYQLQTQLGSGFDGWVWKGYDTLEDRVVAIKQYSCLSEENKERRRKWALEEYNNLKLVNELGFDFVPKLYDYYEEGYSFYIVMEHFTGPTLQESWIDHNSWSYIWNTLKQAYKILTRFHEKGIVYGDSHSSNFVWHHDRLMLVDFASLSSETYLNECYKNRGIPEADWGPRRNERIYLNYGYLTARNSFLSDNLEKQTVDMNEQDVTAYKKYNEFKGVYLIHYYKSQNIDHVKLIEYVRKLSEE